VLKKFVIYFCVYACIHMRMHIHTHVRTDIHTLFVCVLCMKFVVKIWKEF
jgi:hypothetical protein